VIIVNKVMLGCNGHNHNIIWDISQKQYGEYIVYIHILCMYVCMYVGRYVCMYVC
jgi:hypothetical protein